MINISANLPLSNFNKDKQHTEKAAQSFEAHMLKQVLKEALPRTSETQSHWQDIALDAVAASLVESMPFGVASLLEKS